MIYEKHLRIGNWIMNDKTGKPVRVEAILRGGGHCSDGRYTQFVEDFLSRNMSGIPITADAMSSMGFSSNVIDTEHPCWYIAIDNKGLFSLQRSASSLNEFKVWWNNQTCFFVPMQFVHQIQNCVFTLTGHDLEFILK
jgi:hypothetical protein